MGSCRPGAGFEGPAALASDQPISHRPVLHAYRYQMARAGFSCAWSGRVLSRSTPAWSAPGLCRADIVPARPLKWLALRTGQVRAKASSLTLRNLSALPGGTALPSLRCRKSCVISSEGNSGPATNNCPTKMRNGSTRHRRETSAGRARVACPVRTPKRCCLQFASFPAWKCGGCAMAR
jgi:hypothetical protein